MHVATSVYQLNYLDSVFDSSKDAKDAFSWKKNPQSNRRDALFAPSDSYDEGRRVLLAEDLVMQILWVSACRSGI